MTSKEVMSHLSVQVLEEKENLWQTQRETKTDPLQKNGKRAKVKLRKEEREGGRERKRGRDVEGCVLLLPSAL